MVFIVYIKLLQALTARLFVEISKLYLLPKTPEAVILFMYMTTVIYAGSKGARVLGRLNEILFYISVVVLAIIFISLSQADLTNILPVGSAGAADIFKGALATMYHYSGIEAVLVFYTLVARKQEVMKSGIAAIIITMLTYVVVAVICQLVLGTSLVQKLVFPGLTLVKAAPVPVIERFEFIFLVFWVGLAVRPTLNMSFAASLSLSQLLGINLQKHFAYVLTAVSLLIFICALIPRDILQALRLVPYAGWLSITMGIGFPLLLLLVSFIRGKKVENGA
jgi:spore germination protein (amino acid permease)